MSEFMLLIPTSHKSKLSFVPARGGEGMEVENGRKEVFIFSHFDSFFACLFSWKLCFCSFCAFENKISA